MLGNKKQRNIKQLCLLIAVILVCGAVPLESALAVESGTMLETEALTGETQTEEMQTGETLQEPETEPVKTDPGKEEPETAGSAETEPESNTDMGKYTNSISGVLWVDANEDGTYDSSEQALADYPVYLYLEGDTDNAVQTATTDADGKYLFEDITPGRYVAGIKAEEKGTEYLLPLVGVQKDNKFYFTPDYSKVISNPIDIAEDTVVEEIDASMRTMPQIQPMANVTYTIDLATVTTATAPTGTTFSGSILTFTGVDPTDSYIITTSASTARYIVVNSGEEVTMTISGVTITSTVSPIQLLGTAELDLTLSGTNTLRCSGTTSSGVNQAGVHVAPSATLKINGGASDTLTARGGYFSAGIGGSYLISVLTTTIATARLQNAAGTIEINGGTVYAYSNLTTGGCGGAGIGGAVGGNGGNITINNGTVTASTYNNSTTGYVTGAGIGSGRSGDGGTITITGGTVTAHGGTDGAGIGSGSYAGFGTATSGGNILISGGTVTATGGTTVSTTNTNSTGSGGAGIGGGATSRGGTIAITGGTVTATGGYLSTNNIGAAGIGGGAAGGASGDITISGGTVTATGQTNARDIGGGAGGAASGSIVFVGGSILPTRWTSSNSYVYPAPTNGSANGSNPVGRLTFTQFAGQDFSIVAGGTVSSYTYAGTGHAAAGYLWLAYPGASTGAVTAMSTTPAVVTAPSTVNSAASSTAVLNGSYYLNSTYPVTSARFEWGTSTSYGTTIDMTSSVNTSTTTTGVYPVSSSALTGLTPGTTYHYRFVIVTNNITVRGNDMTFTPPALAPSVDVIHDYPGGTTATLEGIYDLNGGTFVSGKFEISDDGGSTWLTPTGGTLTGSTTTPSVILTGLTPGTTYHYRLAVINSEGTTITAMKELTPSVKNLTITKMVTGAYADMTKAFNFTVYFRDSTGAPLTGGTQFTYTGTAAPSGGTMTLDSEGKATFTLSHGQTITIAGVSTSGKVQIVETTDANYTTSFVDSTAPGTTIPGADTNVRDMTSADRTFAFTNARKTVTPTGVSTGGNALTLLAILAVMAGLAAMVTYRRRRKEG